MTTRHSNSLIFPIICTIIVLLILFFLSHFYAPGPIVSTLSGTQANPTMTASLIVLPTNTAIGTPSLCITPSAPPQALDPQLLPQYELYRFTYGGTQIPLVYNNLQPLATAVWATNMGYPEHEAFVYDRLIWIFELDAAGTPSLFQLTPSQNDYSNLAWSPDGRSLIYVVPKLSAQGKGYWVKRQDDIDVLKRPGPSDVWSLTNPPFGIAWGNSSGVSYLLINQVFQKGATYGILSYFDLNNPSKGLNILSGIGSGIQATGVLVTANGTMLVYKDKDGTNLYFQPLQSPISSYQVVPSGTAQPLVMGMDKSSFFLWTPDGQIIVYMEGASVKLISQKGSLTQSVNVSLCIPRTAS